MRKYWGMRIVSALLVAVVMLCSNVNMSVLASDEIASENEFKDIEEADSELELEYETDETVDIIPDDGEKTPEEIYGESANDFVITNGVLTAYRGNSAHINIPEGVVKIGDYCFADNLSISGINFPTSLREIGNYAFSNSRIMGCYYIDEWSELYKYTGLIIPNGVTTIGAHAFDGCYYLDGDLTIPNSVTSIGDYAFYHCGFDGNLTISDSITTIGDYTFYLCSFTGSLTIPDGVATIGDYAFSWCDHFTGDLIIPDSVTTIGNYAFSSFGRGPLDPPSVGNLVLGNNVTSIGDNAFSYSGITGNLIIPNSVTSIGSGAFSGCEGLTGDLTIPGSVKTIGWAAFHEPIGFNGELILSEGVETIEYNAFMGCNFTGDLTIPNSVKTIGNSAFSEAGFTGKLNIGNGITKIQQGTFSNCGFSGNLIIPNNVTSIGKWAFLGCTSINDIYLSSKIQEIGDYAFHMSGTQSLVLLPATFHCSPNSYSYNWVVRQGKTPVTNKIKINQTETVLESGDTFALSVIFDPFDQSDHTIVWASDNEDVATVSSAGVVTALQKGTAMIKATAASGTVVCKVTVKQKVTSFTVKPDAGLIQNEKLVLFEGQTGNITLSTNAGWIPWDKVTITNNNTTVATYAMQQYHDQIAVNGLASGDAVIGIKIADLPEQTVIVHVKEGSVSFKDQNGTDFASPIANKPAVYGERYPELPIPEEKTGFLFVGWFTQPEMKGKQILEDTIFTGDEVLYAGWVNEEVDSFTVLPISDQVYSGSAIVPRPQIYHRDRLLVLNQDYSLKYNNNTNASTTEKFAEVVITGKGSFAKTEAVKFTILPKPLGTGNALSDDFTVTIVDKQYNGKTQISKPTIKFGKITLKENRDYTLSYEGDQVGPGTVSVIITGKEGSNYTGSAKVSYTIYEQGKGLSTAYVSAIPNQIYTGETLDLNTIPITVKETKKSKETLIRGTDYDVVYADGTNKKNVGTVSLLLQGKGIYSGTKTVSFKIAAAGLTSEMITVDDTAYTGVQVKPEVTVRFGGEIVDPSNYTVTYKNNTKAEVSTAGRKAPTVTIKGKGNLSGSAEATFTITPLVLTQADLNISVPDIKDNGKEIGNSAIKPTVKYGNPTTHKVVTLKKGTDYDVTFTRANAKEMQTVNIILKGNYKNAEDISAKFRIYGTQTVLNRTDFIIEEQGSIPVYSGSKILLPLTVKTTVDGEEQTLTEGKDYTVGYTNNINAADKDLVAKKPTWKITGKGAYKGTVSGTFTIAPYTFTEENFTVTVADVKNNGNDQKPKLTIINNTTGKALKTSDFTAVYGSTKVSTDDAQVTITGQGNYIGNLTGHFRVYDKSITTAVFEKIDNMPYTGRRIMPNGDLVVAYADKNKTIKLQEGVDYTLSYGDNVKAGTGTVIVTGIGDYGGSKTIKFTIVPKWLQWLL